MSGYNLPPNVSASDAAAPWNQKDLDELWQCQRCGFERPLEGIAWYVNEIVDRCPECQGPRKHRLIRR